MTWRTHAAGGIAALWLLPGDLPGDLLGDAYPGGGDLGLLAVVAALGALLPDLDARASRLGRLELPGGIAPFALPARALHRALGHRGPLHSLAGLALAATLIALPLWLWAGPRSAAALCLGYASHLALDMCTKTGVPLLWPDRRRRFLLPPPRRVTTGSPAEEAVTVVLALAALGLLLAALRPGAAPAAPLLTPNHHP